MRLLISVIFFIPVLTFAQSYHVRGVVNDDTGKPLPFANVVLYNQTDSSFSKGVVTDENGSFDLVTDPGKFYLKISFLAFEEKTIPEIRVVDRDVDLKTVTLQSDTQMLQEVQIEGEKAQMEFQIDKRIYNVSKDLNNIGGNAADLLDNIPSVTVDVDGAVSLRGSQNVRIFINGKPSALTSRDPNSLRQLQSSMIERVEVITNPSARYEASGDAGIINIILKKDKEKGLNGVFNGNAGYPTMYGGSYRLNYHRNNLNFFSSYGIDYRKSPGYTNSFQIFGNDSSDTRNTDRISSEVSHNLMGGLDYYFDDKTSLTASVMYSIEDGLNDSRISYNTFRQDESSTSTVRTDLEAEDETNFETSLNFKKEFERKDHTFSADFQYINSIDAEHSDYTQTTNDGILIQRADNISAEENFLIQSDYIHPFGKEGRFETGFRSTHRSVDNDYMLEDQIENAWIAKDEFNNILAYDENIHGAYFIVANKYNRFSYQAGIRAEYSDIRTELIKTNEINDRNYLDWFPSINLSYNFTEEKTFQLSYSRRISRPHFRQLLPFSNFTDTRVFFVGNPNLNPEYTHAFEANYLLNWESGSFLPGVYYRYRTGVIERITEVDSLNISRITPVNLSTENAYGIDMNLSNTLKKWWTLNVNAVFFRAITEGFYEDELLRADAYSFSTRTTSRMTFFKKLDFQASLNYRAPRATTQGRTLSVYSVDLALSKDVLKEKGTITFNVRDLFNSRIRRSITDIEGFYSESTSQWRPRQFRITFTYRLNQAKQKQRDQQNQSIDDDF